MPRTNGVISLKRKRIAYNPKDNPFHITGEYGCRYNTSENLSWEEPLNLVHLCYEPVKDWTPFGLNPWRRGKRDGMLAIDSYLSLFVCSLCEPTLRYWHTQRQIFLTELADQLPVAHISPEDFTTYDTNHGACDLCGTADSAISELTTTDPEPPGSVYGVTAPYILCPTCRDLLLEWDDELHIDNKPLSEHPHHTVEFTPDTPITDPDFTPHGTTDTETEPVPELQHLSKDDFVDTVGDFNSVSRSRAAAIYDIGITSLPELADAPTTTLTSVPLVGRATAKDVRAEARAYIELYENNQ